MSNIIYLIQVAIRAIIAIVAFPFLLLFCICLMVWLLLSALCRIVTIPFLFGLGIDSSKRKKKIKADLTLFISVIAMLFVGLLAFILMDFKTFKVQILDEAWKVKIRVSFDNSRKTIERVFEIKHDVKEVSRSYMESLIHQCGIYNRENFRGKDMVIKYLSRKHGMTLYDPHSVKILDFKPHKQLLIVDVVVKDPQ